MNSKLRRARQTLRQVSANPRWGGAYWQARRRARSRAAALRDPDAAAFSLRDHPEVVRDERGAVLEVTGASPEAYDEATRGAWLPQPEHGDSTAWDSRVLLLRVLATIVRLTPPEVAIEIGVERGYSSAVILHAMEERGSGRLESIDLPSVEADRPDFTGHAIPSSLRARWELTLGPSRKRLPEVLERVEAVDLLLHDGDHSYESQMEDLEAAWPRMSDGAIVVVDDVWSDALYDFARERGLSPVLVERIDEHDGIGLLRKRG